MPNKISQTSSRPVGLAESQAVARPRPAAQDQARESGQAGAPAVEITDGARQLATLEKAIANVPVVSDARVAEVSQALTRGTYRVDGQKIADRLLRSDAELAAAHSGPAQGTSGSGAKER
jgi:flagellar biosynthesis anti-sigma factor FlgM